MVRQVIGKRPIKQQESIHAVNLKQLNAETSNVDMVIMIHDDPVVDIILETYEDGPELKLHHADGVADILVINQVEHLFFQRKSPPCKLQIIVPTDVAACWQIRSGSGDISAGQLITDSIHIKSGSGDVDIFEIKAHKACFKASSGDITARKNKLNELQFETSSGDVEMETIHGNIMGEASSGDIVLTNQQGDHMELETSSGDINVKNSVVKQAIYNASSGDIEVEHFKTEQVSMRTTSGDMVVRGFTGEMKGSTNSGDINLSHISQFMLDLRAHSGDVTIAYGQASHVAFDVKTDSGEIINKYPMQVHQQTKNELSGVIGDGGNLINVKTSSGDILLHS